MLVVPRSMLLAATLLAGALPLPLAAQGRLIPRPCQRGDCPPPVRPCVAGECPRPGFAIARSASDVRVELRDRVLRYQVDERFVNHGGVVGEADYVFPLPKNAAFEGLKLEINGELVAGEIMDAEHARQTYEAIVRQQRDPALVEWMGHGLLRARIFPIAPGEEKRVVVRFQAVAEREGDALRVEYGRGAGSEGLGSGVWRTPRDPRRQTPDPRRSFTFLYPDDGQYGTPYSPTHALRTRRESGRRCVVEVEGDASDVTLLLPVRRAEGGSIAVLAHAPGGEDGFALITVTPPAPRRAAGLPRDVTLVLDVSGSMSGRKLEQAKAAGRQLLATLSPADRFRIIDFSSDVRTFRDELVPATRAHVREAERYLDDLEAQGSTNIAGALDEALRGHAFDDVAAHDDEERDDERRDDARRRDARRRDEWPAKRDGRLPVVLFITDGEPTVGERRPEAIAERAAARRGRHRIFTFGVGADVNAALVERLAVDGRGTAHFVRPEESVERAVALVASRLTAPLMTDVTVRATGGVRLRKLHPSQPADVFAGQDLVLLARYAGSGPAELQVEGRAPDGKLSWTTRVAFPERERRNTFVARLWATQRVGYLSAERRKYGASAEVDAEIRELGERYGIPTEFTSYFVPEPGLVVTRDGRWDARGGAAATGGADQALQSNSVRRRGAAPPPTAGAAPAAAAAPAARAEAFERAAAASAQREARTLAAVDSAASVADAATGARRVGGRRFVSRDGVWVDARYREGMRTVRVRAYSAAYFALLDRLPDLRDAFAVGDRVVVAGRTVAVAVDDAGAESLSARELREVEAGW